MPEKTLKDIISNPEPQFENSKKSQAMKERRISPTVISEMVSLIEEGEEVREENQDEPLHLK